MGLEQIFAIWKNLPEAIDPVVFGFGPFSVRWYSLMYLAGFTMVFWLLKKRLKKNESIFQEKLTLEELFAYLIFGLLAGARIGYLLFYDFANLISNPIETLLPFENGTFTGYYGLSYHGGLIGVILTGMLFCKIKKISFTKLSDFVIPAIPLGYFFGRIGNFLNGELFGRPTDSRIGMIFPADKGGLLRHPSQLYEALLEGLAIFLILWPLRNSPKLKGNFLSFYLMLYGMARLVVEFFRQPDPQLGFVALGFSMGQFLSLLMIVSAIILWRIQKKMH